MSHFAHFVTIVLSLSGETAFGQNCGCAPNLCCSKWGYCGLGDLYCDEGCQSGPCYDEPSRNISAADIVTDAFFNGIADNGGPNCPGKEFYSRTVFLESLDPYPRFASGSNDVAKREIAAFFAHVTHETGSLCHIEEINGESYDYCDSGNTQYPCVPGKKYFGRGPIQLSWNYNYGAAGQSIGFDGLDFPDIVARDPVISFETALWFCMNNNCHNAITSGQGFGATIRAINGMECDGGNQATVNSRVKYFTNYCSQFGVEPGANLYC
ncbi:chitinase 5-like [Primulina huaijiensis]|uniref:chitinase 5-like n=1 Tax=Primulina huaijiensis TaxID=1492673 RepID=UPI003CC75F7C